MNNFIFAAIVVLAAANAKVQIKGNQTNKERKENYDGVKVVARK
jgi:phage portal protein BeeE